MGLSICVKIFNGFHSGGSSFVNINDCWLLQKLFVYHRYKVSFKKKKKKKSVPVYGFAPRNRFGFANRVGPGSGA